MPDLDITSPESSHLKVNSLPDVRPGTKAGKLDYIDALRGIAALSVLIFRIYGRINIDNNWIYTVKLVPERYMSLAMAGVPLFFISAFTLYLSLDNRSSEKKRFTKFYLRRFFRIAPLFYSLLVCIVLYGAIVQKRVPSWVEVLSNFTFTFNLMPQYSGSLLSDGWTIGVEMLFYLFLPLIFIKVNNIWKSVLFFIAIYWISPRFIQLEGMILGEEVISQNLHYNLFHWAFVFAIGILCYLIYKSHLPKVKSEYRTPEALCMLSLSIIILFGLIDNIALYNLPEPLDILVNMNTMSPIAFSLMILSLSLFSNRLIVNRITRFYGKVSYSLYLIHPFFVVLMKPVYSYIYAHTIISTDISLFFCFILTLLVLTPVSLLAYRFIESPGIMYGKRIIAKL